eukprot:scaffold93311_cov31-Tisochrysis_lutea.AAC.3
MGWEEAHLPHRKCLNRIGRGVASQHRWPTIANCCCVAQLESSEREAGTKEGAVRIGASRIEQHRAHSSEPTLFESSCASAGCTATKLHVIGTNHAHE